jgi:hypothetical protein
MGILDDAIREHLELKRAHGASDDEVSRKEAEVFGAVRQEVAESPVEGDETQLLQPADLPADPEAPTAAHELEPEPLQPSPEDAYSVHPGDHPVPDPHDHAHPAGADPAWGEDTEFFSEPVAPPEPAAPIPAPPHHEDEPHPALHDRDAIHSEEHAPEPAFRPEAAAPAPPPPVVEPPIEDPPVHEPPIEEPPIETPPDEEDVLEETPEFLQDAPEHDRLWFEQKPPRDFDFGE